MKFHNQNHSAINYEFNWKSKCLWIKQAQFSGKKKPEAGGVSTKFGNGYVIDLEY